MATAPVTMVSIDEISKIQVNQATLFPDSYPEPPAGEFELGLVMGGTVSAGAYTAGVVDFLIEALDEWEAHRAAGDASIPDWKVTLKAMTGTSGGGVTAGILARALSFDFPHVRASSLPPVCRANPPYHIWVESLNITGLLDNSDLAGDNPPLLSLLNVAPLDACSSMIGDFAAAFPGSTPKTRNYLPEPLPFYLTLANLTGIPYLLDMGGRLPERYMDHGDYVRLAAFTRGGNAPLRPDEIGLSDNPGANGFYGWDKLGDFALGTAAFPAGLKLRQVQKPVRHLCYRPMVLPADENGRAKVVMQKVDWQTIAGAGKSSVPDPWTFLVADGGVTDNEPIELCRRAIAGWIGRNPRSGMHATRAVLLVDPLVGEMGMGPTESQSLLGDLVTLVTKTWKEQARYDSRDLQLAADENCFSRFMITPYRRIGDISGERAIACASLGAFGGFLSPAFRHHDFLLGRANCQEYLRTKLVLPVDNKLFSAWRTGASAQALAKWMVSDNGVPSLPVIPLFGNCAIDEQLAPYPQGAFQLDDNFQDLLGDRIKEVIDVLKDQASAGSVLTKIYLTLGELVLNGKLKKEAVAAIQKSLNDWGL